MIRVNDKVSVKIKVESGLRLGIWLIFNHLGLALSLRACLGLQLRQGFRLSFRLGLVKVMGKDCCTILF